MEQCYKSNQTLLLFSIKNEALIFLLRIHQITSNLTDIKVQDYLSCLVCFCQLGTASLLLLIILTFIFQQQRSCCVKRAKYEFILIFFKYGPRSIYVSSCWGKGKVSLVHSVRNLYQLSLYSFWEICVPLHEYTYYIQTCKCIHLNLSYFTNSHFKLQSA